MQKTKICPRCHKENKIEWEKCYNCGEDISSLGAPSNNDLMENEIRKNEFTNPYVMSQNNQSSIKDADNSLDINNPFMYGNNTVSPQQNINSNNTNVRCMKCGTMFSAGYSKCPQCGFPTGGEKNTNQKFP